MTTQLVVEVDRVLPAAPATVFRALTDPAMFALWMGPAGSTIVVEELDPRIDGRLSFRIRLPDGGPEFHLYGVYREIDPDRRVVHTWLLEGEDIEVDGRVRARTGRRRHPSGDPSQRPVGRGDRPERRRVASSGRSPGGGPDRLTSGPRDQARIRAGPGAPGCRGWRPARSSRRTTCRWRCRS